MVRVTWTARAVADLESVVTEPAVRHQLKVNAENILHDIPPVVYPADEGFADGIMWHRGTPDGYEEFSEQDDGPQNYFLFYRRQESGSGFEVLAMFEILAVRSIYQIASAWVQMNESTAEAADTQSPSA
jgi:hypothetical protein